MSGKLTSLKQSKIEEMKLIKNESICTQRPIMTSRNFERIEMHVFEVPEIESWNSDMYH